MREIMTATFVSALKAEIAQLEEELRSDPRQRKLSRLRETLAEYEPANKTQPQPFAALRDIPSRVPLLPKSDMIKNEIIALLQQRGTIHRKEILRHLTGIGLMGGEKDPMASLAAYFSRWRDIFDPDGAGNWSLKQPSQAAE
jgi:hypothetical protein